LEQGLDAKRNCTGQTPQKVEIISLGEKNLHRCPIAYIPEYHWDNERPSIFFNKPTKGTAKPIELLEKTPEFQEVYEAKLASSLIASKMIGNLYTASLYLGLQSRGHLKSESVSLRASFALRCSD